MCDTKKKSATCVKGDKEINSFKGGDSLNFRVWKEEKLRREGRDLVLTEK